jgi:hypothetical protein
MVLTSDFIRSYPVKKVIKTCLDTENAEKTDGNPMRRVFVAFDFIRIFRPFRVLKRTLGFWSTSYKEEV